MFNFFRKKTTKFPLETQDGNLYIKADKLFYYDRDSKESVDLSILQYAYVEILDSRAFLFLFDHKQHYISCQQKGFSNVYGQLAARFGFDDALFFKTLAKKKEQKHRIFILNKTKNYQILDQQHNDFSQGFEVLCTPSIFVSWDANYAQVKDLGIGHSYSSELGIDYYKIDYPVRIGSLIIDQMEFCDDNDRKQIAVQSYFATINNNSQNDGSYNDLRKLWTNQIPTILEPGGYEREDQKYLTFDLKGVCLSICYTYDTEQYESGNTTLGIANYRDYSSIILKQRNDLKPEFTQILEFKSPLSFIPDYQNNSEVTAKPTLIQENFGDSQTLYFNKQTNRFGFTSDQYAIEYAIKEVEQIIIQNVLPAKGGGYAQLSVKTKKNNYPVGIFYADQNQLDPYRDSIEKMLGIKVVMPQPYYNC